MYDFFMDEISMLSNTLQQQDWMSEAIKKRKNQMDSPSISFNTQWL